MMIIRNLVVFIMVFLFHSCLGQDSTKLDCNNETVDKGWKKKIGPGVCVRPGYTINFVEEGFDYNHDGINDLAVRYTRYPLNDGNLSYFALFAGQNDNEYSFVKEFRTLAFPIIKELNHQYFQNNPLADSLSKVYPTDKKINFYNDTLALSIKTSLEFGKSFYFVYDNKSNDWVLMNCDLWIGEIPSWYVQNMELSSDLVNKKLIIKTEILNKPLSINEFDMVDAYKFAKEEVLELEMTYDINKFNK